MTQAADQERAKAVEEAWKSERAAGEAETKAFREYAEKEASTSLVRYKREMAADATKVHMQSLCSACNHSIASKRIPSLQA